LNVKYLLGYTSKNSISFTNLLKWMKANSWGRAFRTILSHTGTQAYRKSATHATHLKVGVYWTALLVQEVWKSSPWGALQMFQGTV
jgi:hypothetical protein